jgi:hypothetical protein
MYERLAAEYQYKVWVEGSDGVRAATREAIVRYDAIEQREKRLDRLRRGAISNADFEAAERAVEAQLRLGHGPTNALRRAAQIDPPLAQAISLLGFRAVRQLVDKVRGPTSWEWQAPAQQERSPCRRR